MTYTLKNISLSALLTSALFSASFCYGQKKWNLQDLELKDNWQIQSSAKVRASDAEIAQLNFNPENWYKAQVPRTVLAALIDNGVYKDVFFDQNLEKIDKSQFDVPWWYRTVFSLPKLDPEQQVKLQFNGINYRADIWINGKKIASQDTLEGGFRRFTFDISKAIHAGDNVLALKVQKPKAGNPTLGFVDWNPTPPDRDMGVWRDVHLLISGPVSIDMPFVQTNVDTATLNRADITISTIVHNHSSKKITGQLKARIVGQADISQPVTLLPGESKKVAFFPKQYAHLVVNHPKLWWTHDLGNPNLYNLTLQFNVDNQLSDSRKVRFGIRAVSDYMTKDGHRGYKLNGKKILIKGGGWTDPMLLNATPEYERAGIDYAVHMNLNTIRMEGFWGNNEHLYNLCDEKGILIMVGWSAEWEWKGYMGVEDDKFGAIKTAEQMRVAALSWKDQVVWLRNHPSIGVWMYGSDKLPRPELEKEYLDILKNYDPTRPSVAAAAEHKSELSGPTGVKMRGPYDYVPPVYWYVDQKNGGAFGFNTETGPGPQIPVLESLKKMIPAESLWPIGDAWLYHAARNEFHNFNYYNRAIDNKLGKPADLEDYLRKAQYINYEGMRTMYEAFQSNKGSATGIIQWMYNSSWPKLWWQLYDYYLMPTGAFYGARKAGEPLHISYNYGNNGVEVMNNTGKNVTGLFARIRILNYDLKSVFEKEVAVPDLDAQKTLSLLQLSDNDKLSKTYFLDLRLRNGQNSMISSNFYALSTQADKLDAAKSTWFTTPQSQFGDLTMLQQLPQVKLDVEETTEQRNDTTFVHVTLKNPASQIAFMTWLNLKKAGGESVVPVFWDDNYITLLPGEERVINVYCHTKDLAGQKPKVVVSGWNVKQ